MVGPHTRGPQQEAAIQCAAFCVFIAALESSVEANYLSNAIEVKIRRTQDFEIVFLLQLGGFIYMPRFFIDGPAEGLVSITGEDARHIAGSLRMTAGETLTLCDAAGFDYSCEIIACDKAAVQVAVREKTACKSEPSVRLRLYQALPKSDKLELIVQKAVELGVGEIVPVLSARCVSRPDAASFEKKRQRLCKIALEAAKQCGRGRIPAVLPLVSYAEAVSSMKADDAAILFYEQADTKLTDALRADVKTVSVFVGAEGGISPEEALLARENGVLHASLGPRILRCETAAISACALVMHDLGQM